MRVARNALIVEWFPGIWTKKWTAEISHLFHRIYILPIHETETEAPPGTILINDRPIFRWFEVDCKAFDEILTKYQIDVVFQPGYEHRRAIRTFEFIRSRNLLIDQGRLSALPVDQFVYYDGFLPPSLYHLDAEGWGYWSSFSIKDFPKLTPSQKEELQIWLQKWRQSKRAEASRTISREQLIEQYNIDASKTLVLCPLQGRVGFFTGWCSSQGEYIDVCLKLFDEAKYHVLFKHHPVAIRKPGYFMEGMDFRSFPEHMTFLEKTNDISVISYIEACDLVCVVNSTVGCEALALGKPVITLGLAAYGHCTTEIPDWESKNKLRHACKGENSRADSFLYHLMKTCPGRDGLPVKYAINLQAKYVRVSEK